MVETSLPSIPRTAAPHIRRFFSGLGVFWTVLSGAQALRLSASVTKALDSKIPSCLTFQAWRGYGGKTSPVDRGGRCHRPDAESCRFICLFCFVATWLPTVVPKGRTATTQAQATVNRQAVAAGLSYRPLSRTIRKVRCWQFDGDSCRCQRARLSIA